MSKSWHSWHAGCRVGLLTVAVMAAACGHQAPSNPAAPAGSSTASTHSNELVLDGTTYPLHDVRCVGMGGAVLVSAKTPSEGTVIVDAAGSKLETLDVTADGVGYFWEPTSTGGVAPPALVHDADTYSVSGKIKQLHDSTKFSDFALRIECPK